MQDPGGGSADSYGGRHARRRFGWLLPMRGLSFGQRFAGNAVAWGLPVLLWQGLGAGVFRRGSRLPLFLAVELPATALGVLAVAGVEHAFLRRRNGSREA